MKIYLLIIGFLTSLYANEEVLYSEKVKFDTINDPGYVYLVDGRSFYFGYINNTFDVVYKWEQNQELSLIFTKEDGALLINERTNEKLQIQNNSEHLLDANLNQCLKSAQTTLSASDCYSTYYDNLDSELNRLYKLLQKKLDKDMFLKIKEMQRSWIKFRDNSFKVEDELFYRTEGTIRLIEAPSRKAKTVKSQVAYLESIYFYSY